MKLSSLAKMLLSILLIQISFSCKIHNKDALHTTETSERIDSVSHTQIPFTLTPQNNIVLPGIINGKDTLDLMFHTAITEVSLTEDAAQHLFELASQESVTTQTWGGEGESKYIRNNHLAIGNFEWDSLTIWVGKLSGHGTQGKFGPNLFKDKIMEINFDTKELNIHPTLPQTLLKEGYNRFEISYQRGIMYIAGQLQIDGQTYLNQFMIHSGYSSTILLDDQFANENRLGEQLEIISESELRDSYGNVLKTKKSILPAFTFGGHTFTDMPVNFFEGSLGRQKTSVLGSELLKRFNIILDPENAVVYLKPNGLMELPFEVK